MKITEIETAQATGTDPHNMLPRESVYKIEEAIKEDPSAEIQLFKKAWADYRSGANTDLSAMRARLHQLDMALDLTLQFVEGALTDMGEKLRTDRR